MATPATTRGSKSAAVALVVLAVLIVVQMPHVAGIALYIALLMAGAVLIALFAAARLWTGDTLDGQVLAGTLAVLGLVGQALNFTVGLPGASPLHGGFGVAAVLASLLEVSILVFLALDAFRRPAPAERPRPYAL